MYSFCSADTVKVSQRLMQSWITFGAPVEIIMASIFLYQILGWSAFLGMAAVAIVTPLNSMLSKRGVVLTKSMMEIRGESSGLPFYCLLQLNWAVLSQIDE